MTEQLFVCDFCSTRVDKFEYIYFGEPKESVYDGGYTRYKTYEFEFHVCPECYQKYLDKFKEKREATEEIVAGLLKGESKDADEF